MFISSAWASHLGSTLFCLQGWASMDSAPLTECILPGTTKFNVLERESIRRFVWRRDSVVLEVNLFYDAFSESTKSSRWSWMGEVSVTQVWRGVGWAFWGARLETGGGRSTFTVLSVLDSMLYFGLICFFQMHFNLFFFYFVSLPNWNRGKILQQCRLEIQNA